VIAAWQIGQLDEDQLQLYKGLLRDVPQMQAAAARIEAAKDKIRKAFYQRQAVDTRVH
jgi:hypothetical protein